MSGTIRKREAKQVATDYLINVGVPKSSFGFTGDELQVLVGSTKAVVRVSAKMTFYQLQSALDKLRIIVDERLRARDSRQRDIEEFMGQHNEQD